MTPSVSVVIPVYNAEKHLEAAVQSVLAQEDDGILEIILIEDGSTDDSLEVADSLCAKHRDICRLLRHDEGKNLGAGASRNKGIKESKGEYICFLDADDYWLKERLKGALPLLSSSPEIDGVYDQTRVELETNEEKARFSGRGETVKGEQVPHKEFFAAYLNGRVGWDTLGIVLRRKAFDKVGLFDESLRLRQDGQLWFRMAAVLHLARSPLGRPVAVYRRHGKNRFNPHQRYTDPVAFCESEFQVWESLFKWFKEKEIDDNRWELFFRAYLRGLGKIGYLEKAWQKVKQERCISLYWHTLRTYVPGPRRLLRYLRYLAKV